MRVIHIAGIMTAISSIALAGAVCAAVPAAHGLSSQIAETVPAVSSETGADACYLLKSLGPDELVCEEDGFGYVVREGVSVVLTWPAAEDVSIPDELGGLEVAAVAGRGTEASKTRTIRIPATVRALAGRLFYGLPLLESVEVDLNNLAYKSIDGVLFEREGAVLTCYPEGRPEESYSVPEGTRALADDAFHGAGALKSLTLSGSVESVGIIAVSGCSSLEEILVTEGNAVFESRDGVLFERETSTLVRYPAGRVGAEYEVPAGTRAVGASAFHMCSGLNRVDLPDGLECVGASAFAGCASLEELRVPASVSAIGELAFYGCPKGSVRADEGTYAHGWLESDAQNRSAVVGG